MGRSAPHSPALKLYFDLNAAALIAAAALMILLAKSGGFSIPRLVLVGVTTTLAIAAAAVAILLHSQPAQEHRLARPILDRTSRLGIILAAAFLGFWCLTWFPPQYAGNAYHYFIGTYPLILCGLLASGSALVLLVVPTRARSSTDWWAKYFRVRLCPALYIALSALAAFGLVALLTAQFGILHGREPYWYGAGVPLLVAQVLIAALIAVPAFDLEHWPGTRRLSADLILFVLIWAAAASLWAARPVPASYWVTAPRPPNFEYYPFSDLITFDVASQFALIGQGIFNGMFFDRALYMSFLVYLHTIGGQNYQQLMSIQAALFAVFPALLYLIGRNLHSRAAGLVLAALTTLRGLTSLDASAWIDTATFKHMLTDFPTAILVAGFLLLILKWMQAPRERLSYLIWAGGLLGLASLLRPHVLLLMAGTVLLALWLYRPRWKRSLSAAALALLAFLLAVLPWMTLGPSSVSLFTLYGDRVRDVIALRYPRRTPTTAPAAQPTLAAAAPTVPAGTPAPAMATPVVPGYIPPADPGLPFVADHFLHNLVTSAMVFPVSPQFLSVRSVVKEGEAFWRPRWDGGMSPLSALMLVTSLAWVAFGIGTAIQRDRLRGLVPIAVLLLYVAANSLARTSGGRYIVPVDWILIGYFSIATAELLRATRSFLTCASIPALAAPSKAQRRRSQTPSWLGGSQMTHAGRVLKQASHPLTVLVLLLLLGASVPLAGVLYPPRYTVIDRSSLARELRTYGPQAGGGQGLEIFLQQPDATLVQGRLLYPLYYHRDEGAPTRYAPYTARGYPRTVFMLIGPQGIQHVLLPGDKPRLLPNAVDVVVLGCRLREQNYNLISALEVALPEQQTWLVRSPAAPLNCPLPEPVCDNNGNCY